MSVDLHTHDMARKHSKKCEKANLIILLDTRKVYPHPSKPRSHSFCGFYRPLKRAASSEATDVPAITNLCFDRRKSSTRPPSRLITTAALGKGVWGT